MGLRASRALAVLVLLLSALSASGKDFPEPVLAADPLAAAASRGAPAGLSGAFEYGNYLFAHDDVDSFYFRSGTSPVVFAAGDAVALGLSYESVLMCAPVPAGGSAANIVAFWMTNVQFEYGFFASARLPLSAKADILAEYSRTSQHPLRSPVYSYSELATDILMLGLSLPELRVGPFRGRGYLRLGYIDLFGFWQSSLPKPRASWVCRTALEAKLPLGSRFALVARVYPELFIDRYKAVLDANIFSEAGIAVFKGVYEDELLLTLYATKDSELLKDVAHPAFEAGLALRLAASRL